METNQVGVVIPNYNNGKFLLQSAESAAVATGSYSNIVVVDDGSREALSHRVLAVLEGRGASVIRQKNRGVSVARNVGIAHLQTPYILPLDSDDIMAEGAARAVAQEFARNPGAVLVAGGARHLRLDGTMSDAWYPEAVSSGVMRHRTMVTPCTGFRREDWEVVGGFPEGVSLGEDWIFWLRLLRLRDEAIVVRQEFLTIRDHEGQTTRRIGDVREVARAQNIVLRENPHLVDEFREEFLEELCLQRSILAEYRHAYRYVDAGKRWVKATVARSLGISELKLHALRSR